ncbi:uncharacterized protein LOC144345854 [Saccoglossus kowalevskii]
MEILFIVQFCITMLALLSRCACATTRDTGWSPRMHKIKNMERFMRRLETPRCEEGDGFSCGIGNGKCFSTHREACDHSNVCGFSEMCLYLDQSDSYSSVSDYATCQQSVDRIKELFCTIADIKDWTTKNEIVPNFGEALDIDLSVFGLLWSNGVQFCDDGRIACPEGFCLRYQDMCDAQSSYNWCSCDGLKQTIHDAVNIVKNSRS